MSQSLCSCVAPSAFGQLVEMEVRELLDFYEFPGDDIPVVRGSALAATTDGDEAIGKNAILELMEQVDEYIPLPEVCVRHFAERESY